MNLVAVVQARMGSTRLPRKVLLPLAGKPLLERLIERIMASDAFDDLVVATTTSSDDDPIRELCRKQGIAVYSGHSADLLDRHYRAGITRRADAVAKIPSDCPLIDPGVIARVAREYRGLAAGAGVDFVSNLHPASYPDGNDVEIVPMAVLETAWREAVRDFEREHTTPFLWERPERFRLHNVRWEAGRNLSMSHRFTIDCPEDYTFVNTVYDELHAEGAEPFSLAAILSLLERRPDIFQLNAHLAGVNWYRHHLGELRTIGRHETVAGEARR